MNFEVEKDKFKEIEKIIHSDTSPVGIDAKKTHVLILNMLNEINKRLDTIEGKLK